MKYLITILLFGMVLQGMAQSEQQKKMEELQFMEGTWSGDGWMVGQDRVRTEFTQTEEIRYELNGMIMVVRGIGKNVEGETIHNALGIVSYDLSKGYQMNAYLDNGQQTLANMEITGEGKLRWWFDPGNGSTIQYSMEFKDGIWTEKGEFSPDKVNWYPFLQFTLKKQ